MTSDQQHRSIEVVNAYIRALNAGDLDAIVSLYADGAAVEDPAGSLPKVGRAAIRDFYASSLRTPLAVELEGEVRVVGRTCAFPFSVSLDYEGRRTTIRPIDLFDFDESGHIQHMRAYFGPANIHH